MTDDIIASTDEKVGAVTVVIDLGSAYVRGGISGEDNPRCEFKTITEKKCAEAETACGSQRHHHRYPIDRGCVRDWEAVESLLHSVYSRLPVREDTPHALLLTRHVFDPVTDAARYVQFAVEVLQASAVCLATQPVLTLYAHGRTDGVVLDCGDGVTQVVPIFDGYAIDNAIIRQDLAGSDVSVSLQSLLAHRHPEALQVDVETAREVKEKLCYVAANFDQEVNLSSETVTKSYTLPGGDVINVNEERFRSPEILFKPTLIGSEKLGLSRLVHKSVSACPIDLRGHLLERIILAGGTTKTPGICRRLLSELSTHAPRSRVKIVASPGRQHSAWLGGSVLACLPSFAGLCVTKAEYLDQGDAIVRKKIR